MTESLEEKCHRYEEALTEILKICENAATGGKRWYVHTIAKEALQPPEPEVETVEVVRWMCKHCGRIIESMVGVSGCCTESIVLKGSYTRPVKPKVKRREKVRLTDSLIATFIGADNPGVKFPRGCSLYAEWEE